MRSLREILRDMEAYEEELSVQNDELRRTQTMLQLSLDRYHELFEHAPVGYLSLRENYTIAEANHTASKLLGISKEQLLERHFEDMVVADDRGELEELFARGGGRSHAHCVVGLHSQDRPEGAPFLVELATDVAGDGSTHARVAFVAMGNTGDLPADGGSQEHRLRKNQRRLRATAERLSRVEEDQRRKLALDLHDLIGQTLVIANMKLGLLERRLSNPSQIDQVRDIRGNVRDMVDTARDIIAELRPPVLDEHDFQTAVMWLCHVMNDRHAQNVHTEFTGHTDIEGPGAKEFLFRAIRELLKNAALHSGTDEVFLSIDVGDDEVVVDVRDEGAGFDVRALDREDAFGLYELRERVEAFGGRFSLETGTGRGTKVGIVIPLVPDQSQT
jgi:PAS domain S-box-containing protein